MEVADLLVNVIVAETINVAAEIYIFIRLIEIKICIMYLNHDVDPDVNQVPLHAQIHSTHTFRKCTTETHKRMMPRMRLINPIVVYI